MSSRPRTKQLNVFCKMAKLNLRMLELCIERVQRRFTKTLPGLKDLTYEDRLKHLKLPSLELRRLHADLVYCYKIIFGYINDFFTLNSSAVTRGHAYKIYKHQNASSLRRSFFSERVVNCLLYTSDAADE